MRTPQYRMSRYFLKDSVVTELYEYKQDLFERRNIASEREDVIETLLPIIESGNFLY